MQDYDFKELDLEGMETLEAIAAAPRLNQWMYETISKRLTGRTLEIGSGIGNISEQFIKADHPILLTDIRDNYCDYLRKKFGGQAAVLGVEKMDIVDPDFDTRFAEYIGTFDSLFALNVVEHIKDDSLAIRNCKKLLKPGGRMVILVPAYQALFNGFDKALEHYRRYNKKSLKALFQQAGMDITHSQYFNLIGIAGWYVSGNILKKKVIPTGQMKVYNALVPIFRVIDKIALNNIGLSVIVEGVKPLEDAPPTN
jgi:2-polyprenyl-3-methyl-5-hydroxy-6-metoxy-1,4-benzoquinol methylase